VVVTDVRLESDAWWNFELTPYCPGLIVQPGGPCYVDVVFTPSQIARVTALYSVTDQLGLKKSIFLEGSGSGAFPNSTSGAAAMRRIQLVALQAIDGAFQFTLRNGGQGTITGLSAQCTVAGGTVLIPPASTLAPGATTTVRVRGAGVSPCGLQVTGQNTSNSPWILGGY